MDDEVIQDLGFTLRANKFDFFFGRVTSEADNTRRSSDNLDSLKKLGIDEYAGGRERLLQIFQAGLNAPEIPKGRKLTSYGTNISRKVEVTGEEVAGAIIVGMSVAGDALTVKMLSGDSLTINLMTGHFKQPAAALH